MNKPVDFFKQPLYLGDTVALLGLSNTSRELVTGTIAKFTPKGVTVAVFQGRGSSAPSYTNRAFDRVIKKPEV